MKTSKLRKSAILPLTLLVFAQAASAVTPAEEEEKKCIKPKFRDFVPAPKSEVKPESEISFHINHIADPLHIKANAKNIPLKLEIVDKKTFYYVKAKLPEELKDGYARIHVQAKSAEGECIGQDGWLIKITDNPSTPAADAKQAAAPAATE
ncbi:hypothetical protein MTYM_00223 [Methylococcales bacterium]|nr:hypothetical protein MTYM_00223 [Methylococcales bacterium]